MTLVDITSESTKFLWELEQKNIIDTSDLHNINNSFNIFSLVFTGERDERRGDLIKDFNIERERMPHFISLRSKDVSW